MILNLVLENKTNPKGWVFMPGIIETADPGQMLL